jgi:hypothetical protein
VAREGNRRGSDGRFIAGGDLLGRYAAVAQVLRAVDPDRPERVSMRRFDVARERAGHGSLPRAQSIATWLGMPWAEVKAVALDEKRDKVRTYRSRHRSPPRPWDDADGALNAMKRVAEAFERDDLAARVYDDYRENAAPATRELLPTAAQIVKLFGSWEAALARACLRSPRSRPPPGLSVVDAIGVFVRTQGCLPGRSELEAFAADPRWAFPLQRIGSRRWQAWIDDFEKWWVGGLERVMPAAPLGRSPFVPLNEADIVELPNPERPPKNWWNRERVVACVIAYLEEHPEAAILRQPSYRAWATERTARGIWTASPTTLTKYGTLEQLEREARQKVRA